MSIETLGSMNKMLSEFNSKDWVKSAKIDIKSTPEFKELSELGSGGREKKLSFSDVLAKSISDVNNLQKEANTAIEKLATGQSKNIHETMLAVERADIAFRAMNQVRLKVIEAYKEVMRMQV